MDEPESQLPWQLFCHLKGTDCYEIACTAADTEHLSDADSLKLVFLNCQDPPALQMSSSGRTSFDYTFNDSRVLPISVDNTSSWLSVTLDHFPDDVIGLAVSYRLTECISFRKVVCLDRKCCNLVWVSSHTYTVAGPTLISPLCIGTAEIWQVRCLH